MSMKSVACPVVLDTFLRADCGRRGMEEQNCPACHAKSGHHHHEHLEPEPPFVAIPHPLQRKERGLHTHVSPL